MTVLVVYKFIQKKWWMIMTQYQIMHWNLLSSYILSFFSLQLLYISGKSNKKGSIAIARLFSIICQIILERRLPEKSNAGFVLISMSHTLPLESIRKSYPKTSKENIFLSPFNLSSAALMLTFVSSFILLRVPS